jgi:hypothetical protein
MKDNNKRKSRRRRKEVEGDDRIKNVKEEPRQTFPGFTAEASLPTTTTQQYRLSREYTRSRRATIRSAISFLNYLCYYKCMIQCGIISSSPRMCLMGCPKQCQTQRGLYGI